MSGAVSYHAGVAAEASVERAYRARGYAVDARRWRSAAGEIDLIARSQAGTVFIEVKKARDFSAAAERLRPTQFRRIAQAAELWLGERCGSTDSEARIDVALVNDAGELSIIENVMAG